MYLPFLSLLSQKIYLTFEGTVPPESAKMKLAWDGQLVRAEATQSMAYYSNYFNKAIVFS